MDWFTLHPRIKVIGGATQFARFLAEADEEYEEQPRDDGHPDRYSYSPTATVYTWRGKRVIVCETRQNRYEAFKA
jgi:hypothetical protein